MPALSDKIVAYLNVNSIAFGPGDYQTGQPEGGEDQVFVWNADVLGAQPDDAALDAAYAVYADDQKKAANKAQASQLLAATDWTAMSAVADPAVSNPHLTNQVDFFAYRSALRAIAVNPTVDPVWPSKPAEQWA